ncbi:hypothetical protein DL89DRAFT_263904, partial [Linderina pennispora]
MDIQQPDSQLDPSPVHRQAKEYSNIINFGDSYPHRVCELPEAVFRPLLLDCYCPCGKSHARFLTKHSKLHLVTELRVIIYNRCRLPMDMDKVIKDMASRLPSSLPNVRSILFLGEGIFMAGLQMTWTPLRNLRRLSQLQSPIRRLFPCNWGPAANITSEISRLCPLYECTLKEYMHQLEHVQMLIPFPLNVPKLFDNLTSLSINIRYVRLRRDLPAIPTQCLRILEVFQIEAVIPWHLFDITEGALDFGNLESLHLEFIQAAAQTVNFPGCDYPIHFPKLSALNITGSAYVYTDIYAYFQGRTFERLTIMDDPTNFERINEQAFESVKILKIGHPTRIPFVNMYSVDMVERLYQLPSNAEEAVLGLLDYPLPELIAWVNLRSLTLTASIADKHGLANLLGQLPLLHTLIVDCFSMSQKDVGSTNFPDQKITFDEIGEILDSSSNLPVSESLERLDLFVRGAFDMVGFCELVSRLPR